VLGGLLAGAIAMAFVAGPPAGAAQTAPTATPITFTVIGMTPTAVVPKGAPAVPPTATRAPITITIPTSTPRPTSTPIPTATPSPTPPSVAPSLTFTADDWAGAYYQGNGQFYGRAWVAVYGALSDFPRAALSFDLPAAPDVPMALQIVGLDDERVERNRIALEINGQVVYEGGSPFADWDGVGNGANAAWTQVTVVLPPSLLQAGTNEVAIANLEPVASFNSVFYVLLSDAALFPAPAALLATAEAEADSDDAGIELTAVADDDDDDDEDDEGEDG